MSDISNGSAEVEAEACLSGVVTTDYVSIVGEVTIPTDIPSNYGLITWNGTILTVS